MISGIVSSTGEITVTDLRTKDVSDAYLEKLYTQGLSTGRIAERPEVPLGQRGVWRRLHLSGALERARRRRAETAETFARQVAEGMTVGEIAQQPWHGYSAPTVRRMVIQAGGTVPTRPCVAGGVSGAELRRLYESGMTIREIAETLPVRMSYGRVHTVLVEAGTQFRHRGAA